jgi:hypothetical protein
LPDGWSSLGRRTERIRAVLLLLVGEIDRLAGVVDRLGRHAR